MGRTPPRTFSLADLATLVNDPGRAFDVMLKESSHWIDWESSTLLVNCDAKILEVRPEAQWPLQISFTGGQANAQAAPFYSKMEFYCHSRSSTAIKKSSSRSL